MKEEILSIVEFEDRPYVIGEKGVINRPNRWNRDCTGEKITANGFTITTTNQVIELYCENASLCCENWGYFMSNDNLPDFIGAKVLRISATDTALNEVKIEVEDMEETSLMFVNIETNRGLLQFTAYNEQNGYYGHLAGVVSVQYTQGVIL